MNNFLYRLILFFSVVLISQIGFGKVKRISEKEVDLSKPHPIYMTAGRATLLDFPCDITPTILGLTNDITATIGPDNKNTMTLWVNSDGSQPTNMIVKCNDEVFVFDILPNRSNHQDYINIVDYYDGRFRKNRKLISSSWSKKVAKQPSNRKLIASSSQKRVKPKDDPVLRILNKNRKPKKLISKGHKK